MHINLLFTKEEQLKASSHSADIVVVLDVLLATSTIVECLAAGVKAIYPVATKNDAFKKSQQLVNGHVKEADIIRAGEINARTIEEFVNPTPLELRRVIKDKHLILLTTNGTVAIENAKEAEEVYISSLLNGQAVAAHLIANNSGANIDVVCSGSNGKFGLEDFYGAGHLIHSLIEANDREQITLSDSSIAAQLFYESNQNKGVKILTKASVGRLLVKLGLVADIHLISKQNKYKLVPFYKDGKIIIRKG